MIHFLEIKFTEVEKKMRKGKKSNVGVLIIAFAIIGIVIGAAGTYFYMTDAGYGEGYAAGVAWQAARDRVGVPASLTTSLSAAAFAHTGTVIADGSVPTEVVVWDTLSIENTDDERTAGDVKIVLYNPVTDKEGFNDNLETDSTEFAVALSGGTFKIFDGGDYITNGYTVGDIAPGGSWNLNVSLTLEVAAAGTFQDGQSYTCYLYVYQGDADYADVVSFTVTT